MRYDYPEPFRVYVGGPIHDCSFDEAKARNAAIAQMLRDRGLTPIDPLDFEGASALAGLVGNLDAHAERLGLVSGNDIVRNCLDLIDSCDALLVNLMPLAKQQLFVYGTPCEQGYAYAKGKLIVTACPAVVSSVWAQHLCTHREKNLPDAVLILTIAANVRRSRWAEQAA